MELLSHVSLLSQINRDLYHEISSIVATGDWERAHRLYDGLCQAARVVQSGSGSIAPTSLRLRGYAHFKNVLPHRLIVRWRQRAYQSCTDQSEELLTETLDVVFSARFSTMIERTLKSHFYVHRWSLNRALDCSEDWHRDRRPPSEVRIHLALPRGTETVDFEALSLGDTQSVECDARRSPGRLTELLDSLTQRLCLESGDALVLCSSQILHRELSGSAGSLSFVLRPSLVPWTQMLTRIGLERLYARGLSGFEGSLHPAED